jgi:hypothetical protein
MSTLYIILTALVPSVALTAIMVIRYYYDKHKIRKRVRRYSKELSNMVANRAGELIEQEVLW